MWCGVLPFWRNVTSWMRVSKRRGISSRQAGWPCPFLGISQMAKDSTMPQFREFPLRGPFSFFLPFALDGPVFCYAFASWLPPVFSFPLFSLVLLGASSFALDSLSPLPPFFFFFSCRLDSSLLNGLMARIFVFSFISGSDH